MNLDIFINGIQLIINTIEFQTFVKLVLIVILSGIIGFERESWSKPAGFRTHVLVGISAVLVMVCGEYIYNKSGADPTRIPAQLLSGIGFLGAGTILRDGFNVKGLTTAASLLAVTCIGLSVGAGFYLGSIIATAVVYVVLSYSHVLSTKIDRIYTMDLEIVSENPREIMKNIEKVLDQYKFEIANIKIVSDDENKDCIKVLGKMKEDVNKNKLLIEIMSIDKVNQVVEI